MTPSQHTSTHAEMEEQQPRDRRDQNFIPHFTPGEGRRERTQETQFQHDLLFSNVIRLRPVVIAFLQNSRYFHDSLKLFKNNVIHVNFFPQELVSLVLGVVGVAQSAVRPELKFQELVPELPLVPHVVAHVELIVVGHHALGVVGDGVAARMGEKRTLLPRDGCIGLCEAMRAPKLCGAHLVLSWVLGGVLVSD